MPDKYRNFAELAANERRFRVRSSRRDPATIIVAPHGGKIEPGTSEIAEAIAGTELSFYAFEGTKARHNRDLHITSTRFDEPHCLELIASAERVITIHGEETAKKSVVFLGGSDATTLSRLRKALMQRGFCAETHKRLRGHDPNNISNKGSFGAGVQVELSHGLRRSFFRSSRGRKIRTRRFCEFVLAVREAITTQRLKPNNL